MSARHRRRPAVAQRKLSLRTDSSPNDECRWSSRPPPGTQRTGTAGAAAPNPRRLATDAKGGGGPSIPQPCLEQPSAFSLSAEIRYVLDGVRGTSAPVPPSIVIRQRHQR